MKTPLDMNTPLPVASREVSGKYVVIGMFTFSTLATILIFVYWNLHTRPFRPLTEAIGREFRYSVPKIEGGRHKGGPSTLRIAMRVNSSPVDTNPDTQRLLNRVVELARQELPLANFETMQVHLFYMVPEKEAEQASYEFPVREILQKLPYPDVQPLVPATAAP